MNFEGYILCLIDGKIKNETDIFGLLEDQYKISKYELEKLILNETISEEILDFIYELISDCI